jgi:hypothetical protein
VHSSTDIRRVQSIGGRRLWVLLPALVVLAAGFYFARRSGSDYRIYTNDFNVYYFAARELMSGHDPYTASLGPSTTYLYPPLLAELIMPLAMLPLPVAAYLWFLASAGSLAAAAMMCAKLVSGERPDDPASSGFAQPRHLLIAGLSALVLLRFALDTFDMGQVNAIVVCLSVAHVYLFARGKSRASAVVLALASAIKLWPALLVLYHISRGRTRLGVLCSVLIAAVTLGGFVALGPRAKGSFEQFYRRTIQNGQGFDLTYSGNQSLRGALGRAMNESGEASQSPSTPIALTASGILLLLSIFVARLSMTEAGASAPFFCCMVLISPLAWKNHFILLLLPVACLAGIMVTPAEGISRSGVRARSVAVWALVLSFVLFNLTSPKLIGLRSAEWADAHSLVTLGGLAVLTAGAYIQRKSRNRKASSTEEPPQAHCRKT